MHRRALPGGARLGVERIEHAQAQDRAVVLAHFLERSDALLFPVGLKTVNLQTSNMKGLAEKQLFRYRKDGEPGGRWFNTTNGANQDRFCDQLVDEQDPNVGLACDSGIPGVCAAGVNQRAIVASATAAMPPCDTASMRCCHSSTGPM